jgi:hypothetical protein
VHFVIGDATHDQTTLWLPFGELFGLEAEDRLADRRPTDLEPTRQLDLAEAVAGPKPAGDDRLAQGRVNVLGARAPIRG